MLGDRRDPAPSSDGYDEDRPGRKPKRREGHKDCDAKRAMPMSNKAVAPQATGANSEQKRTRNASTADRLATRDIAWSCRDYSHGHEDVGTHSAIIRGSSLGACRLYDCNAKGQGVSHLQYHRAPSLQGQEKDSHVSRGSVETWRLATSAESRRHRGSGKDIATSAQCWRRCDFSGHIATSAKSRRYSGYGGYVAAEVKTSRLR